MKLIPANIELENERVRLRMLDNNDSGVLLRFAMDEPELWKYSLQNAAGEQGMITYLDKALSDFETGTSFPFIVYDKREGAYAGSTRFYDINIENKTLQLGYTWYGKKFQGTGLNKNCKFLLLEYAFEILQMERVEFRADAMNSCSIAAMKSIGCQVEGILRRHFIKPDGSRRDSIILSILKPEWHGTVKENLSRQIENLL